MDPVVATILTCVLSSITATVVAIINSNSQHARSEQKSLDAQAKIEEELKEMKAQMLRLSETDSCCTILKDDVAEIKETMVTMSATINQFKAESDENDNMIKEGFRGFAKDRINQAHRYFMSLGYIDEKSKEALHDVYKTYKECKGNTFIDEHMEDLNKLPEVSSLVMKIPKGVRQPLLKRIFGR